MNTQARYIIEKKLFKLEVGLIADVCIMSFYIHMDLTNLILKKVANIVTPDFMDGG